MKPIHYRGLAFRAHHPGWAYDPVSGEGARRHGGRFNRKGQACLYLALDYRTAWLEAQQGFAFKPQPLTICAYDIDCTDIADASTAQGRRSWQVDAEELAAPWEYMMHRGEAPPGWQISARLRKAGMAGLMVRSFAPGARADNINLVLWQWSSKQRPHKITVIDDDARLPKDRESWR